VGFLDGFKDFRILVHTVGSETSFTPDSLCFYFSNPQ
jgi:hypothetical protein